MTLVCHRPVLSEWHRMIKHLEYQFIVIKLQMVEDGLLCRDVTVHLACYSPRTGRITKQALDLCLAHSGLEIDTCHA